MRINAARVLALVCFLLAGVCVVLWWRAVALYPVQQLTTAIYQGEKVEADAISAALARSQSGWPFASDPGLLYNQAVLALYLAETTQSKADERRNLRQHALTLTREALAWYPADPFLWTRYSYIQALDDGRTRAVADSWRLAVLTAPYVPELLIWQIHTGLWLRPILTAEETGLLTKQIHTMVTARRQRYELVRSTFRNNAYEFVFPIVSQADPTYAAVFSKDYMRLRQKKH